MKTIYLLSISGPNRPGITRRLMGCLSRANARLLDIGQAVIHDALSLGCMVLVDHGSRDSLEQDINDALKPLGLSLRMEAVSVENYAAWVGQQGQPKYVLTLLAPELKPASVGEVTALCADHNLDIYHITRLTGRIDLGRQEQTQACVEMLLRGHCEEQRFRDSLLSLATKLDIDLAYQRDDLFRRNRRLVAFDMDSTLIKQEVIDELAKEAGVGEQVAQITARAMRGELDFTQSLTQRVAMLKGLPVEVLERVARRLVLNEGAEKLLANLNKLGFYTVILSGGFDYFGQYLQSKLDIGEVHANRLEIAEGVLTGRVTGTIVDGKEKARLLKEISARQGYRLEQVIAVGDGANDLPMLGIAGLGVAFHAKPLVQESAKNSLSNVGLDAILYLIGVSDFDAGQVPAESA